MSKVIQPQNDKEFSKQWENLIDKLCLRWGIAYITRIRIYVSILTIVILIVLVWKAYVLTSSDNRKESLIILLFVFLFGALGGTTSVQQRLKKATNVNIEKEFTITSTFQAALFGGVFAEIFLLAFLSNFVNGELFPQFKPIGSEWTNTLYNFIFAICPQRFVDYAKLFIWSFIAGFSERKVLSIIDSQSKK